MIYEIESKNDILTGASVSVKIPGEELDKKALHTLQSDKPGFILPFISRNVDGCVEFIYQIGSHSKLQYLSGARSISEYTLLWSGILDPLLNCGDWFMKPYSFVLSAGHLYYDKNSQTIRYIYIPSLRDCSEPGSIKDMAAEFSKFITVTDAELENKVLRAIIKDFDPKDFLRMLETSLAADPPATASWPAAAITAECEPELIPAELAGISRPDTFGVSPCVKNPGVTGDIIINIPADGRSAKKMKTSILDRKEAGERKEPKKQKSPRGLFGGKKADQQEIINGIGTPRKSRYEPLCLTAPEYPKAHADFCAAPVYTSGAAAYASAAPVYAHGAAAYTAAAQVCTSGAAAYASAAQVYTPGAAAYTAAARAYTPPPKQEDITQSISSQKNGPRFRLVGSVLLPPVIDVRISTGGVFTIGRFDAATGRQLSSFEFDKKTKAVSRRHAAIEREADRYMIIDLASSAGTFLDGQRLPPNTPCEMGHGCRVSFGNAGADYVWEG